MGGDGGIGCDTMRYDAGDDGSKRCKDVDQRGTGCAIGQVLPNFLAGEKEQPLERKFNLDFDLLFDTTDDALLEALLRPDGWNHAGVSEDIVI